MLSGETSMLLWLMAGVVALLAAYLFIGWVRRAQSNGSPLSALGQVALGGASLGAGIASAMVLAMSAEGLPFPLGWHWRWVPVLFLAPMLACIPVGWWLSRRQNWLALGAAGLLIGAVAVATQAGWLLGAGLRPGLRWNYPLVGAAVAINVAGFTAALWLAYSDASGDGARKSLWRVGAAVLMALATVAGQEVMVSAVGLLAQVGSIYQREATSTILCLVAGALVPTVMAVLALDLVLRNRGERRRHRSSDELVNAGKRRKKRRKYRML
jgi:diguanylate cyclase